ncbi:hypothetical protein ABK040_008272 [Willaertia magna]
MFCLRKSFFSINTSKQQCLSSLIISGKSLKRSYHSSQQPFDLAGRNYNDNNNTSPKKWSFEEIERKRIEEEEEKDAKEFEQHKEEIRRKLLKDYKITPEEFIKGINESEIDENLPLKQINLKDQLKWWFIDHDRHRGFIQILANPTATMEEKHSAKSEIDKLVEKYGEVRCRPSRRDKISKRLTLFFILLISFISFLLVKGQQRYINDKERSARILDKVIERNKPLEEMKGVPQINPREIVNEIEKQQRDKKRKGREMTNFILQEESNNGKNE